MDKIEEIKKKIYPNIDETYSKYLSFYLYGLDYYNLLPSNDSLEEVAKRIIEMYPNFVLYDDEHPITLKYGKDIKGVREVEDKTIYVRNSLDETLKSITIFHEIHHAAQTQLGGKIGIYNPDDGLGRLIMEAQTQYCAELIYSLMMDRQFRVKEIPTQKLRLPKFGTVVSNLHNYELYDNLLSKLSILLGVEKNYFITLCFFNHDDAVNILKLRCEEARINSKIPFNFEEIMIMFDYIYVVDYMSYIDTDVKKVLNAGLTTKSEYIINRYTPPMKLSNKYSKRFITYFDMKTLKAIRHHRVLRTKFSKYIVDNDLRNFVKNVLN